MAVPYQTPPPELDLARMDRYGGKEATTVQGQGKDERTRVGEKDIEDTTSRLVMIKR